MNPSNNTPNKMIKFGSLKWVAAAGIFAIIVALCFVAPSDSNSIFSDNFTAPGDNVSKEIDLMLSTRGGSGDDKEHASLRMIREGMEYYNNKEYDKAIPIFQEYLEKNKEASDYNQIQFYLAVSFLSQGETERSAKLLEQLAKVTDQNLQEDAKWYLSLAYARTGDTEKAKAQLQDLASSERYGAKAEKILDPNKTKVAFK